LAEQPTLIKEKELETLKKVTKEWAATQNKP